MNCLIFQSTLPVWGATIQLTYTTTVEDISIHAPRVGSDRAALRLVPRLLVFQSTLPVWGATSSQSQNTNSTGGFQSTLPVWGATSGIVRADLQGRISIHAPRVGSDILLVGLWETDGISIHAPRVGSDVAAPVLLVHIDQFQSTLPVWGATFPSSSIEKPLIFQSTLPVWGATYRWSRPASSIYHFNPRSPCGERPVQATEWERRPNISIHAPRVGSDSA